MTNFDSVQNYMNVVLYGWYLLEHLRCMTSQMKKSNFGLRFGGGCMIGCDVGYWMSVRQETYST